MATETIQEYIQRGGLIRRVGPSVRIYTELDLKACIRGYTPGTRFEPNNTYGQRIAVKYDDELKTGA